MKEKVKTAGATSTAIRKTNKKYDSYSVTIPKIIVDLLDLSDKDRINWKYAVKNGKLNVDISIIYHDDES